MREFFGNRTRFTFVSDEYNGEGVDPLGVPRPLVPVRFVTLDEAQQSNGISRIYNGVHWQWDNVAGQELGEIIGAHIVSEESAFRPVACPADLDGNGVLDLIDVTIFVRLFGEADAAADLDHDGVFDLIDLSLFTQAFTSGCQN